MGVLCYISSATDLAAPVKSAYRSSCSYGWSAFVSIGTGLRNTTSRFVGRDKAPAEPAVDLSPNPAVPEALISGVVPGNDETNDSVKNIGNEVKEIDLETSKISVNANDMDNEDSVTLKICDPGTAEKIIDDDDVHAKTVTLVNERLGIWGYISSATGSVRDFCNYVLSAAAKLDSFVMGKVKTYLQDERALSDLGMIFWEVAIDATSDVIRKKVRIIPGGLKAYTLISRNLNKLGGSLQSNYQSQSNCKQIENLKREVMELRAKIDELEKKGSGCTCSCMKLHDQQQETLKPDLGLNTLQEGSARELTQKWQSYHDE